MSTEHSWDTPEKVRKKSKNVRKGDLNILPSSLLQQAKMDQIRNAKMVCPRMKYGVTRLSACVKKNQSK